MRVGRTELSIEKQKDESWRYSVMLGFEEATYGFRKTEHEAREAGWEDAVLISSFWKT